MNTKFWAGDATASSDSESSRSSDNEGDQKQAPQSRPPVGQRYAHVESSSDEENRRVVRSAKDKSWDNMRTLLKKASNSQLTSDYAQLCTDFDNFVKALNKSKSILRKEGIPNFVIRYILALQNFVEEKINDKTAFKKLSKLKATCLNTLRAKVKKLIPDCVEEYPDWSDKMEKCRENPEAFDSESSGADDGDSSDDEVEESSSSKESDESSSESEGDSSASDEAEENVSTKEKSDAESSEGSSIDWGGSDDSSSSSSSESEASAAGLEFQDKHQRALSKWGLKPGGASRNAKAKTAHAQKERTIKPQVAKKEKKETPQPTEKPLISLNFADAQGGYSPELLTKTLGEIMAQRGKKAADRNEMIRNLQQLVDAANSAGPQSVMEIMGHLVSGYFDYNLGTLVALPITQWVQAYKHVDQILSLLARQPNLVFHSTTLIADLTAEEAAVAESTAEPMKKPSSHQQRSAVMLAAFVERLDDELYKALQFLELSSQEHSERLGHRVEVISMLWRAHLHFQATNNLSLASSMALRLVEHLYYLPVNLGPTLWSTVRSRLPSNLEGTISDEVDAQTRFEYLSRFVMYNSDSSKNSFRALLCHVYHDALRDEFHKAKHVLQLSSIQELASFSDVSTQTLYNRAIAQLGLCAFRLGFIHEAHGWLAELCAMNRHRELLAQGVSNSKIQEKTAEQEREEKRRQLPYHMHIGLDLIEAAHNISAMLLEVPNMASKPFDHQRHIISKPFRRLIDQYEKQSITCPPETSRETIVAATRDLQKGDAKGCCNHIFKLKIWESCPDKEKVKRTIEDRVKSEALRTFLFTYSYLYHSFNVSQLSEIFEVPTSIVHSVASKMMIKDELWASWDESSECIKINRVEPSPLQVMALQLSEKVIQALDQNETLLNYKNPRFVMQTDQRGTRRFMDNERYERQGDRKPANRPPDFYRTGASGGPIPIQKNSRPVGPVFRGKQVAPGAGWQRNEWSNSAWQGTSQQHLRG